MAEFKPVILDESTAPDELQVLETADTVNGENIVRTGPDIFRGRPRQKTIFLLSIGQSNPQGIESSVTDFVKPTGTNVLDVESGGYGTNQGDTVPAFTGTQFTLRNPDPDEAAITDQAAFNPYVGYRRDSTGHQAMTCAIKINATLGYDVIVLSITQGAAPIGVFENGGAVEAIIEDLVAYAIANFAALSGHTFPDIILWGQSEGNAFQAGSFAGDYLTPIQYKDAWIGMRANAITRGWCHADTPWFLTEPTQAANWTLADAANGYPLKWQGIYAVDQYTDEKVTLVSSVGIPEISGTEIHYTGNGNNQYGERIADAVMGIVNTKGTPSGAEWRSNVDAQGHNLSNVQWEFIGTDTAFTSTNPAEAAYKGTSNNVTMSHSGGFAPAAYKANDTYTLTANTSVLGSGFLFWNANVFQNADVDGTTRTLGPGYTTYSNPTYECVAGSGNTCHMEVANLLQALPVVGFYDNPAFKTSGAGTPTLEVGTWISHNAIGDVSGSAIVHRRYGSRMGPVNNYTGVIEYAVGFDDDSGGQGTIGNVAFLGGHLANTQPPSGDWNMYQGDSDIRPNKWGASHQWNITPAGGATLTTDHTHHIIECTNTGSLAITLEPCSILEIFDNAAAVNKGGGLVGIPITGHGYIENEPISILFTTNYDGSYNIVSQTANEIVITATYVAETFGGVLERSVSTVKKGREIIIKRNGTGAVTINQTGTDTCDNSTATITMTAQRDVFRAVCDGVSDWIILQNGAP